MKFKCHSCNSIIIADNMDMGRDIPCSSCGNKSTVPSSRLAMEVVIGDFIILHELGKGGMGIVFLAHQISLDRPVALKILSDNLTKDKNYVNDFFSEARIGAKLNHPHILQTYTAGEDDGIFYFAMEYIEGRTMKEVLDEDKIIPIHKAYTIILHIAEALDYAWKEAKMVHRDIKPDNIMIAKNGNAKLADMGLARHSEEIDQDSDEIFGTPQYISPEYLTGHPMDVRSDIYSLGATFYHFITGKVPFQGETHIETARMHLNKPLVSPRKHNLSIPKNINKIIVKMMAKNIEDRYQTPAELIEAIKGLEQDDTATQKLKRLPPPHEGTTRHGKMKDIMVVDSSKENREALVRILKIHGFTVTEAHSGEDVVHLDPDKIMLVLLSQRLPDMTAFEAFEKVNTHYETSGIPFVICTSTSNPTFTRKCIQVGFKEVLQRPYNRGSVFSLIKNILIEEKVITSDTFVGVEEVTEVREHEKIEFLKHLQEGGLHEILPEYNSEINIGYFYPQVSDFFSIDPGEGYDILKSFSMEGILQTNLIDKVNLCPKCSFHTLNFREVCPKCSALDITIEKVLHHYGCGYVGPESDYQVPGEQGFTCPKCNKILRHIGLDYEKPSDTFLCQKCGFIFNDPGVNFKCFKCSTIDEAEAVQMRDIYSYTPTKKAAKAVEYDSLTTFDFKDVLVSGSGNRYTRDFFEYTLEHRYLAHKEFGDSLTLVVIHIGNTETETNDNILIYLSGISGSLDVITETEDNKILFLISRKSQKQIIEECNKIQNFISHLHNEDSLLQPECTIMVRIYNDSKHHFEDYIDTTLSIFEQKYAKGEGKIFLSNT